MTELIAAHQNLLHQAARLLDRIDPASYTKPSAIFLNSAIGAHVRHCLEHYESLLRGVAQDRIDYDDRSRDQAVETQPAAARARLNSILTALEPFAHPPFPAVEEHTLMVRSAHDGGAGQWHASSIGRELQFLVSHTVHHFALIAGLCHVHGIGVESDFGIAPSTLRHRASCHA